MSAQRGVLGRLGGRRTGEADGAGESGGHLVAEVLEACAQDGREKLADLLYEMAVSCMHLIPEDLEPGEVTKSPDPVERLPIGVLSGSAAEVCARVPGGCLGDQDLPAGTPDPDMAAQAARSCLALLEDVEGTSARRRFGAAFVAQMESDHEGVINLLTPMHDEALPEWLWLGVRWLLMATYLRTGRPQLARGIGERALQVCPHDRALLFNTATAHAAIGDAAAFDRICEFLPTSRPLREDLEWWERLLDSESPWIAEQLGRDVANVRASLQLFTGHGGAGS